ncbi:MAG TPA: FAD:protein FMN transferase [Halanaerobiaceae bacterium]|nr:FAD:protein FMN transferase [Bacillota bacterium]HHU92158.1 FAD:protein FMN transferase [Halanaerobiaceae bacterium]HOA39940.1 FAD:protein FMN transferase [Halanaerobiales bacterium]HPZ62015.1 FAD:protein FMN transferase [Halanaerobiales bacterium]HQD03261.1 FAD:protein FMN transferase [Halanaerobiales bacterium]
MKKRKINYLLIMISLLVIISIAFYRSGFPKTAQKTAPEKTRTNFLMNTVVQIKLYGEEGDRIIDRSFDRIRNIEEMMSRTLTGSDIYLLNENYPSQEYITVNPDTYKVLERALYFADLSGGKFDPSIGLLVELWGIGTAAARVPSAEEIERALSSVDYRQILLKPENRSVKLLGEGMKLDLGAIAKGFAADEVGKIMKEEGIESAFVNLGGNVLLIGSKPDGTPWKIGIQDPRFNRGNVMASIELQDKTIVTSGNYERYFEEDGIIYHHILDPETGYPARSDIISVSIVGDSSLDADALSTSVFILGVEKGLELINQLEGYEAMIITDELGVIVTEGLKGKITLLNKDFYFLGSD